MGADGGGMRVLSEEKIRFLVERNGWSPAFAQGHIDGEAHRRRDLNPSQYARVGIDDYSLGFRSGYYERGVPLPAQFDRPDSPVRLLRNAGRS